MLAGHTAALHVYRFMDTNSHNPSQPSQQKPACSHQSCTCLTFPRGCEACAAICCEYNLLKPRKQKAKITFCFPEQKSKTKEQFNNNKFRKVVVSNSIPHELIDLQTFKCKRSHNRPYDACL